MTPRKVAFAQAYIANGMNATQAAITAGYTARSAYSTGSRLLRDAEVSALLAEARKKASEQATQVEQDGIARVIVTADRVIQELGRCAFLDPAKLVDAEGQLLPLGTMEENTRRAISAVEVEDETDKHGRVHKVKLVPKDAALQMLGRHFGVFEKDNAQVGQSYAAIIRAATAKRRTEKR